MFKSAFNHIVFSYHFHPYPNKQKHLFVAARCSKAEPCTLKANGLQSFQSFALQLFDLGVRPQRRFDSGDLHGLGYAYIYQIQIVIVYKIDIIKYILL